MVRVKTRVGLELYLVSMRFTLSKYCSGGQAFAYFDIEQKLNYRYPINSYTGQYINIFRSIHEIAIFHMFELLSSTMNTFG